MKVKDQIIRWRDEVKILTEQINNYSVDVKELKDRVNALAKTTESMTETMLMLIRNQMGD